MRIAYLAQSYPPMISGASIFAGQLAMEMAKRNHQVLVIASSEKPTPYLELKSNIAIHRVNSLNNPFRVGQRFMVFPRRDILKILREFNPDLIHSHDPLQIGALGLSHTNKYHIPCIITLHQLPWFAASYLPENIRPTVESILWNYARFFLKRFNSIIVPTQTISEYVQRMTGFYTNTIGYGIDLKDFDQYPSTEKEISLRQKFNIPLNSPILLHVGRLDTDKKVDQVISAAAESFKTSDAHLLVVGDGKQKENLIRQCFDLGIEGRVHFPGYILPSEGLFQIYHMSNLFITASQIETQGIVLIEAAASKLPIVAVRATCIPEIVHDGVNGFLTEPGDVFGLSESINKLLNNPLMAKTMGKESYMFSKKHHVQTTFDKHENYYEQICKYYLPEKRLLGLRSKENTSA